MSRIAAAPALGCLVVTEHYMAAFGLFVAASVTDFVSIDIVIHW